MKIITLNTWGGKVKEPLKEFLKKNQDIDVFCLQEIYHDAEDKEMDEAWKDSADLNLFKNIDEILENHIGYFRPHWDEHWGLAIFVKKDLKVVEEGERFVFQHKGWKSDINSGFIPKNIQYVKINNLTIINFHGLWNGQGKTDTEERIDQSKKIKEFLDKNEGEEILCGDLNLLPDTESVKILEDAGLRNLIKENKIESTRTSFYTKPDKHADYAFVSGGVKVVDFKVLPDEVSDHCALYLEIE